jgi:tripartite-type tricarboxylate transporter receptor subunit TctC
MTGYTFLAVAMTLAAGAAWGQSDRNYPSRPIRLITSGVGGGADTVARVLSPALSEALRERLVIDNRASGVIPGEIVSRATPDGYTLLLYSSTLWIEPLLEKTPYDPVKDFAPISLLTRAPNILVVTPSLPVQTVQDLIALARAKPGALNYASGGTGASNHVAAELFKAMAGVDIVRISYKSGALQAADLIGGRVQLMFASAAMTPHIKAGRLRAVAVTSRQPSELFPGVPTVAASGVPGYESGSTYGLFAPARTPAPILRKLNQDTVKTLRMDDVRQRFLAASMESVGSSPEELGAAIRSDMARMAKVLKGSVRE